MATVKEVLARFQAEQMKGVTVLVTEHKQQEAVRFVEENVRASLKAVAKLYPKPFDASEVVVEVSASSGRHQMQVRATTDAAREFLTWLKEQAI